MGKSSKKRNKDFKKVKFKVGKKLKKPVDTDTSFKAGKLVLLEQLHRRDVSDALTKRKLTLSDVLQHLRHYNTKVRKEAVADLKQLLTEFPNLIHSNLSKILESLGILLTDVEGEILKLTSPIWDLVLSTTTSVDLSPYFSLIAAHLNCALTHLNSDVKKYATRIFTVLSKTHGDLLFSSTPEFINCFLDLFCANSSASNGQTTENFKGSSRSLMSRDTKLELLRLARNVISVFESDDKTSETTTMTKNLFNGPFDFDTFGNAVGDSERNLRFFNCLVPFCHQFQIELTAVDYGNKTGLGDDEMAGFDGDVLSALDDILCVYNSLLKRMVFSHNFHDSATTDGNAANFRSAFQKMATKNFMQRYIFMLPCRRKSRRTNAETTGADVCCRVNFNLCRFLAFSSFLTGVKNNYPSDNVSAYISEIFTSDRRRLDGHTLRAALDLIKDLRKICEKNSNFSTSSHGTQLRNLLVICFVHRFSKRQSMIMKIDLISAICEDLEKLSDDELLEWSQKINEFIFQLPLVFSQIFTEENLNENAAKLMIRLTRILLLRRRALPIENSVFEEIVEEQLLKFVTSNIERMPSNLKAQASNLIFYLKN